LSCSAVLSGESEIILPRGAIEHRPGSSRLPSASRRNATRSRLHCLSGLCPVITTTLQKLYDITLDSVRSLRYFSRKKGQMNKSNLVRWAQYLYKKSDIVTNRTALRKWRALGNVESWAVYSWIFII
jgi:hypothetical protein